MQNAEIVLNQVKKEGKYASVLEIVKENATSMFKTKSFVVITESSINFYNLNNGSLLLSNSFIEIQRIETANDQITLTFLNSNFTIECGDLFNHILGAILHTIRKILNNEELEKLNLEKFNLPKMKLCGVGPIVSFKERARIRKVDHLDCLDPLSKAVETRKNELKLGKIKKEELSLILSVLDLCKDVKCIEVGCSDSDVFNVILEHYNQIKCIKNLIIDGELTENFNELLKKLKETELCGFGIRNCKLNEESSKALINFVKEKKISILTLENCFSNRDSFISFFGSKNGFFTHSIQDSLISLDVSNTQCFVPELFFKKIPSVFYLNISGCNLEINDIFREMSYNKMINIKTIDISNNKATKLNMAGITLPRTLTQIICDKIVWGEESFKSFMRILSNRSMPGLKLSLNDIYVNEMQWESIFDFLSHLIMPELIELSWNNNKVSPKLFSFLKRTKIAKLSLDNCFDGEIDYSTLSYIASSMLDELKISSGVENNLKEFIHAILDSKITKLDISNNKLGDSGVYKLILLNDSALECLKIDNCGIKRGDILQNVLKTCAFIVPPLTDLENFPILKKKLKKLNPVPEELFNPSYPLPRTSLYLNPFTIQTKEESKVFPTFISREEVRNMKRISPDVDFKSLKYGRAAMSMFVEQNSPKKENVVRQMQSVNPRAALRNDLSFATAIRGMKKKEAYNEDTISYRMNTKEEIDLMHRNIKEGHSFAAPNEQPPFAMERVVKTPNRRRSKAAISVKFDDPKSPQSNISKFDYYSPVKDVERIRTPKSCK